MNILYGIEPDLCIVNPDLLICASRDIVLPKYFYMQLQHLKNGDFQTFTETAAKIVDYLEMQEAEDLLIFKNCKGGTVYFHDQQKNMENIDLTYEILDIRNPLDQYLISLLRLTEVLECQIVFLASSSEIIRKCETLNFAVSTIEEFSTAYLGDLWLQPEMIVGIQARLDPLSQVEWQEETEEVAEQDDGIKWVNVVSQNVVSQVEWQEETEEVAGQ